MTNFPRTVCFQYPLGFLYTIGSVVLYIVEDPSRITKCLELGALELMSNDTLSLRMIALEVVRATFNEGKLGFYIREHNKNHVK